MAHSAKASIERFIRLRNSSVPLLVMTMTSESFGLGIWLRFWGALLNLTPSRAPAFALALQAGLTLAPSTAGYPLAPPFESYRRVRNAPRFIFTVQPFQSGFEDVNSPDFTFKPSSALFDYELIFLKWLGC